METDWAGAIQIISFIMIGILAITLCMVDLTERKYLSTISLAFLCTISSVILKAEITSLLYRSIFSLFIAGGIVLLVRAAFNISRGKSVFFD
ncbi:hypothetical protein NG99_20950 [Erwinia typographi]|uniref:Uncharacterized protein n=1 Tax=Erwinia typographi TaxID=371042 RepID=A0A0A3YPJ1_9GAMM|nr:hypothetical protein [Erwinia typographi]KGT88742.1 hypothetical protein NG99_20950 [Erwinia typographi]